MTLTFLDVDITSKWFSIDVGNFPCPLWPSKSANELQQDCIARFDLKRAACCLQRFATLV